MSSPVIILPFWCQDEILQFCWMLDRWETLTKTQHNPQFLLTARFDWEGDELPLLARCRKYGEARFVKLDGCRTGFPAGCSEMWAGAMKELSKRAFEDREVNFGFWMEYDVMPQSADWLDKLVDRWRNWYLMMGHHVTEEWLTNNGYPKVHRHMWGDWNEHINGAACYSPRIYEHVHQVRWDWRYGWDCSLFKTLPRQTLDPFDMYDYRLTPDRDKSTDITKTLTHGVKSIEHKMLVFTEAFK